MTGTAPHNRATNRHTGPQLFTDTAGTYQYGVYVDLAANGYAFKRNLSTGAVTTLDLSTVVSNHLSLPLDDPADDHWSLSCGLSGDGVLHVVGNNRAPTTGPRYIRCTNLSAFTTGGSWESGGQPFDYASTGPDEGAYTYNLWDRMSDGTLVWIVSQQEESANSRGFDFLMHKWNGAAWVKVTNASDGHFAISEDTGDPGDGTANRAYVHGFTIQHGAGTAGADRFHTYGSFRTGNDDADTQGNVWYIRSNDGGVSWTNISGTSITMPMGWSQRSTAAVTSAASVVPLAVQGIAIDGDGNPHFVCDYSGSLAATDDFRRHYWTGSAWAVAGSGRTEPVSVHYIRGQVWRLQRSFTGLTCMELQNLTTSAIVNISHTVGSCTPVPDPVLMRAGKFSIQVPNGNTPAFYEFGAGTRGTAA